MLLLDRFLGAHFFDTQAGGVGRHVAALLLVLRPPGGLHPDAAGLRLRLGDHPGVLAQGALRLRDDGGGLGRHRPGRHGHVGPSHVRGRHGERAQRRFSPLSTMLVGVPTGIKIFNWLGTMYGGQDPLRHADAVLLRVPLPVPVRGPHRDHALGGARSTGSSPTPTSWSRTSTSCSSAAWSSRSSRRSTTGSRRPPVACSASASGRWHFWLFVIGFNLTFVTMHVPGHARHAAADLHLRRPTAAGRSGTSSRRSACRSRSSPILIFVVNIARLVAPGRAGRRRPVGRLDPRVGDDVAASALQLRDRARWSTSRRPLWDLKHPDDPDGPHE